MYSWSDHTSKWSATEDNWSDIEISVTNSKFLRLDRWLNIP